VCPSSGIAKPLDPKIEATRRKLERGKIDEKKFRAMRDQALTRADDRALFDPSVI
jgi:hypothetical protein